LDRHSSLADSGHRVSSFLKKVHNSPAHGEVCDKVHHIMGSLPHLGAHHSHLLVLVVATDIACQPQRHDYPMVIVVPETFGQDKEGVKHKIS
jgi:hypothetical protein